MGLWWMGFTPLLQPPCLRYPTLQHLTTIVVFQPESNLLVVKNVYAQKSQPKNQWLFGDACRGRGQNTNSNWPRCCITMTHGAASSHTIDLQFKAAKSNPLRLRQSYWKQEFFRPASGNQFFFQIATPMNDATRFYIWKFPTESASTLSAERWKTTPDLADAGGGLGTLKRPGRGLARSGETATAWRLFYTHGYRWCHCNLLHQNSSVSSHLMIWHEIILRYHIIMLSYSWCCLI